MVNRRNRKTADDRLAEDYAQAIALIDRNQKKLYETLHKLADVNDVITRRAVTTTRWLCRILWGMTALVTLAAIEGAFVGHWGGLVALLLWAPVSVGVSLWAAALARTDWEARRPNEDRETLDAAAELQPGEQWPGQHEFRAEAALVIAHMEARDADVAAWRAMPDTEAKTTRALELLQRSGAVSEAMAALSRKYLDGGTPMRWGTTPDDTDN